MEVEYESSESGVDLKTISEIKTITTDDLVPTINSFNATLKNNTADII